MTETIVNQIVTGSAAVNASLITILSDSNNITALSTASDEAFVDFACAFNPDINPVQIERLPLDDVQAQDDFVQIMVFMGSAQAVFFAIFTMNNSLLSIYNDKREWILQRLLMTPTPASLYHRRKDSGCNRAGSIPGRITPVNHDRGREYRHS